MEDTMDVDEENMQMDEDPTVSELPMSTDEDSAQDAGAAMKVVDDAMASDSPDIDISEGPRASSEGPTEMESDTIADEVAGSPLKIGGKTGEETQAKESDEPVEESSLCRTDVDKTGDESNTSEAGEENISEAETNHEGASPRHADSNVEEGDKSDRESNVSEIAEDNIGEPDNIHEAAPSTHADSHIEEEDKAIHNSSEEEEADVEETANAAGIDETSQNNDGVDEDPLDSEQDSRTAFETADNSNITSPSATEEGERDPFSLDGDANSNAASEQRINANEDSAPPGSDVTEKQIGASASGDANSSSNVDTSNKDEGGGKSLAEELIEQAPKLHSSAVVDHTENDKQVDDDHISIDDASSNGGADAENDDHVSVDGSSDGDRVLDHVSVDSDSEPEDTASDAKAAPSSKTTEDPNNKDGMGHTVPANEEAEKTPRVPPGDKSVDDTQLMIDVASAAEAADAQLTFKKREDQPAKTSTVDLVLSDNENDEQRATSAYIRPRSSQSLKDQITLVGKAADTETIISDDPVVDSTASVSLERPPLVFHNSSSSAAEPPTPAPVPPDSSRLALKSQYSVKKLSNPVQSKCLQCSSYQRCPWKVLVGTNNYYICGDKCLEAHRSQRRQIIESGGPPATHIIQIADVSILKKKCALCSGYIQKNKVGSLTWEVMNFCDEDCLSKYQAAYTSNCCNCDTVVATSSMGKYCVRFGHEVKQFCTPICLDSYKKGIKTCSYCQKNLQDSSEGFLAAVGGKDQFRDFCSQDCLEKYDCICNNSTSSYTVDNCIVCDNVKVTQFELLSATKVAKLCSDVCLAAYKFVNNIEVGICGMCNKYYDTLGVEESVTFNNDVPTTFCSKHCMNISVISKRKIVPCAWCKAKKYNFDMVYRRGSTDDEGLFVCSVNCLALHNVNSKALPPKKVNCSYCKKLDVSTYHITMSDASIRHFCSYECVLTFQSAFNVPALNANIPVPEGMAKKIVRPSDATVSNSTAATLIAPSPGPTIQSVGTLKHLDANTVPSLVATPPANKLKHTTLKIPSSFCFKAPEMKNKWTQISVCRSAKCVSCKPKRDEKDVQCDLGVGPMNGEQSTTTDSVKENGDFSSSEKAVIPIPVPIYIPHPMAMYTLPSPVPIPIPVPIIVPIIIPTSLENMDKVIDTMKEILEKTLKETRSSLSGVAGQSSTCDEMLQSALNTVRSGMDTDGAGAKDGGERKKRELEDDDSSDDLVPSKRARLAEEDMSSSETSEPPVKMKLKYMLGPNTWKHFVKNWNESVEEDDQLKTDILSMRPQELSNALAIFVREAKKSNGDDYRPDLKFYLCLGIQYYLFENGRVDDIFGDTTYEEFTDALDVEARKFNSLIDSPVSRVEEEHLWESMQLGAKTPQVLLMTLMYFISLHFNLWTLDEHMQLSFNSFTTETKGASSDKQQGSKVIKLVLNSSSDGTDPKRLREYEFTENKKDFMRCPVRFYEFYITKCPENIKTHSDRFYLMPESSCMPESPVWYRSLVMPPHMVDKMLNRVKMVKEIRDLQREQYGPTDVAEETLRCRDLLECSEN